MPIESNSTTTPCSVNEEKGSSGLLCLELWDSLDEGMFLVDSGQVLSYNRTLTNMLELPAPDVTLSSILSRFATTTFSKISDRLVSLINDQSEGNLVFPVLLPSGIERNLSVKVISFRLDSKPVTACLVREVERFDGEKTIDAHWLLDAVFEGIEDGILIVEPKTLRIHRCNQAAARIFGTSVATLLGRSAAEFLADEPHGDEIVTTISSKLPFLHSIHLDLEMKRSNGSRFPALHGISEILGDADAVIAWMWVVTDMTQRVFLNRTLIDLETRYRLLFDRTADPLIIIDALSRKIIDANPATEVQLGYTRAELIGLGMEDITPPSRRTGMVDDFKSLRPGENASIEGVNLTKTGEQIPVLLGTVLTEFEGRRVYIVSCRDISQQKILEMERLRLQKIEATRELAGGLAHELSQPLQALITIVDILLQTSLNPDKQSQLLQKIPPSVERMAILVEQMKHLVRVETKPYTRADAIVDLQHSSENE